MLMIFHFHGLGYGILDIALLFIFYEFFGVLTNLAGGLDRRPLRLAAHPLERSAAAGGGLADAGAGGGELAQAVIGGLRDGGPGPQRHRQESQQDDAKSAIKTVVPVEAGQEQ